MTCDLHLSPQAKVTKGKRHQAWGATSCTIQGCADPACLRVAAWVPLTDALVDLHARTLVGKAEGGGP